MKAEPDAEWARQAFTEFVRLELAAGGPDPHMRYVGFLSRNERPEEVAWRAGLYMGLYHTPSAEVAWQHWPYEKARANPDAMAEWFTEHWRGLKLRPERRSARTPEKFTRYLWEYLAWVGDLPQIIRGLPADPAAAYEEMWTEVRSVATVGRYAGFKIIEFLRRYAELPVRMPDIRAKGGPSPRLTLAMLLPAQAAAIAPDDDSPGPCAASEEAAVTVAGWLSEELDHEMDLYRVEVHLCNFRQSWTKSPNYPGASNDKELDYLAEIQPYWGERYETEIPAARERLHPERCRGEDRGWGGVRRDLTPLLAETGMNWTDLRYDYPAEADGAFHGPGPDHEAERELARLTLRSDR